MILYRYVRVHSVYILIDIHICDVYQQRYTLLLASRVHGYFLIPLSQKVGGNFLIWPSPVPWTAAQDCVQSYLDKLTSVAVGISSLYLVLVPQLCPVEGFCFPRLFISFLKSKQVAVVRPNLFWFPKVEARTTFSFSLIKINKYLYVLS